MRKGFLATLALLALAQAQGTPPAALPAARPGHPFQASGLPPDTVTAPPGPASVAALPRAPAAARAPWPARGTPGPLEVSLGALAPSRAGELTLPGLY